MSPVAWLILSNTTIPIQLHLINRQFLLQDIWCQAKKPEPKHPVLKDDILRLSTINEGTASSTHYKIEHTPLIASHL